MKPLDPKITRTVVENVGKNMVCSIPGAEKMRKLFFPSRFRPSSSDNDSAWRERRGAQVKQILDAYAKVWGDFDWFQNKVVVELGSGDDISLPFCFALLGASQAYATDIPSINPIPLSPALIDKVTSIIAEIIPQKVLIQPDSAESLVTRKSHVSAESLVSFFPPESVDFITSTSVLEHVHDPVIAASEMFRALRYGGRMTHAIAMGNHCCGIGDEDKLGHLYYPDWLWDLMFSRRVGHNRLRWFEWERVLTDAGFNILDYELSIVASSDIALSRPHLAAPFANMSDEQLAPSYAVVTCVKNKH